MKKYKFIMDDGSVDWVIARTFHDACLIWAQFNKDPRAIQAMIHPT